MPADLETIVQRMIEAGEPEDQIADVIREYKGAQQPAGASSTGGSIAGVLVPAAAAATRAIAPVADATAASPLAVRALSTGAGAAIPAVLTAAAHAAGVPGSLTGPALALGEMQAGKLGARIQPFVTRALNALGSTPGRSVTTGAFQKVPMLSRVLRASGALATPLSALGASADVNRRLEAELPAMQRAILLRQLGIGSRGADVQLPARD